MGKDGKGFERLVQVVAALRGESGCPWDKAQTHETLKSDLLEETYEVLEAIDSGDPDKLREELGDLLMQVMLHSQIASEEDLFDAYDVVETITEKLIRRHPHVFGDVTVSSPQEALSNWEAIKRGERGYQERRSILDGIPTGLPSLLRARKLQGRASRVGFDWGKPEEVLPKIEEEIEELKRAISSGELGEIEEEIGDLLFAVVNLARLLQVEPEEALRKANEKFIRRFKELERRAESSGKDLREMSLEEMDEIWDQIKEGSNAAENPDP
ncbi:TPA: nucleoside triphosphate pyrophosphohydrolase [Candidatus Poribacteria bacterium]|nr:nucleoside triphosphate pyrophosphohydrolase [Candidatus Poribacteria bacterium]